MHLIKTHLLAGLICCTVGAAEAAEAAKTPEPDKEVQEAADFSMNALTEESFRRAAAKTPEGAVKAFFSPRAAMRWSALVQEFSTEQLQDFFGGCLIYRGPFGQSGAVCGLYNPWWDTILLLETRGLPDVPKVQRFYLLAGEVFRGEKIGTGTIVTVVPKDAPISVEACRRQVATLHVFEELYSGEQNTLRKHPDSMDRENLQLIQLRSGGRLKLISELLKDQKRLKQAYEFTRLLRDGGMKDFSFIFPDKFNREIIRAFLKLDPRLRRNFDPYGYIPAQESLQDLYVNTEFPRLFATVTLSRDYKHSSFEWYDFDHSMRVIAIWDEAEQARNGKAVEK